MTRRAIYAGSFDPPTLGHLDLIQRSSELFDQLIVAVGINTSKTPFLSLDERIALLTEMAEPYTNVTIAAFDGLLVHFARQQDCRILVRGLRAVTDFDYEFRVALANRKLAPEIETTFLLAREEYSFLASSVVREVATLGGDVSLFVPPSVKASIQTRFPAKRATE
ncbi:MAG TPA: pantetheine-phosphate adenylyltransferase [Fimbriimonadaceae bacterium]|nr:pantetheine-phosphate adenylyltransferase [Armatimonadota bacterium]HCM73657.1 pantetheine-phosphate adenylyltransferase [Armatimonadota bacterium]HRD30844.1 pantetheine-phosphate adenylyltransferase [Fimbriimonadaceae bacterium]HRE94816.1 pantetheine-phosphate adenylyltransferase [Fimbriimonadaceae bacterium]HRI75246.1 pantetheine-phosphate adenylyltransferase [Fimbriimonadaceae bacterium]